MSPIGGVEINLAIQDAIATANLLTEPLKKGCINTHALAQVQSQRQEAVRSIQTGQSLIQNRIIKQAMRGDQPLRLRMILGLLLRRPGVRDCPARMLAFGKHPQRISTKLIEAHPST